MKKIFFVFLAMVLFTMPICATEIEAVETVSTVTSIASVTGIGVLLVAIITFIVSKLKWFKNMISKILKVFSTVFGKNGEGDKIINVPLAISDIKEKFEDAKTEFKILLETEREKFDCLKLEYEAMHKENDEFKQAFALLCIYANNINPYIKNEIYRLIKGEIEFKETFEETAQAIEDEAAKVQESETKIDTPCLDAIAKE